MPQVQALLVRVAGGERVTAGLLAMTLQNMGVKARSFMGWQLVKASGVHGNARVETVESATLDGQPVPAATSSVSALACSASSRTFSSVTIAVLQRSLNVPSSSTRRSRRGRRRFRSHS